MKTTIKADPPVFDSTNGEVTIKLHRISGAIAEISIDFSKLLPFANLASAEAVDFFTISACAYGIDKFINRKHNSVDGWSRELKVSLPVSDVKKWTNAKEDTGSLLSFLTGDYWEVDFHKSECVYPPLPLDIEFNTAFSQVNLFSGGLDSLIGAIDFLHLNPKEKLLLASHYDSQMHGPLSDQKELIPILENEYSGRFCHLPSVQVSLKTSSLQRETTLRSRSLLFVGIALIVAQAKNIGIVVPENGTVSLNYPLSPSRRSACSTRTTHPSFLSTVRSLWSKIGIRTGISNPYEYETKGEMVLKCKNILLLQRAVKTSNSCGKRGHRAHWEKGKRDATHCGVCMPCVYRRASLLSLDDDTSYGNDINSLPPFLSKKSQDIGACLEFLRKPITSLDIKNELVINGLRDLQNMDGYVDVVLRTRTELKKWIKTIGDIPVKEKAGIA